MSTLLVGAILLSHACAAAPFFLALRHGRLPRPADFAVISFILFYDVGILLRLAGLVSPSPYFQPLLEGQKPLLGALILASGPWFLLLGAATTRSGMARQNDSQPISNHFIFVAIALVASASLAVIGIRLGGSSDIWLARRSIGGQIGIFVLLLYVPLYLLGYYVTTQQSRSKRGLVFCLVLAVCSACATLPVGQRTTILLPFLIIGLFRGRLGLSKGLALLSAGILSATLLLPVFKAGYSGDISWQQLLERTISGDIARDGVLSTALDASEVLGTKVLPYSGAGYVYNLLFFVPRSLAPFKGQATATHFTAWLVGGRAEDIGWGFGIGMIEEISLNFGILFIPAGLLIYGAMLGGMLRLADRLPALKVPASLGAVWLCGYHLRAILMLFGAMAVVALVCELIFGRRGKRRAASSQNPPSDPSPPRSNRMRSAHQIFHA